MSGSITHRIDEALASLPGLQSGASAYAAALQAFAATGATPAGLAALRDAIVGHVAERYRRTAPRPSKVDLYEFSDGRFDMLFDLGYERTVMAHGFSMLTPPNTRDSSYHRGYPPRPGFDKGHAMAHAQGGLEGGPNYFPQSPLLNRRLSAYGHLWRDIETHLAANAGLFCFVRLIYPRSASDVPAFVEYGLMASGGQFRSVVFPNAGTPGS
jgi:hypothetical protein